MVALEATREMLARESILACVLPESKGRALKNYSKETLSRCTALINLCVNVQLKRERLDMLAFAMEDGEMDKEDSQMRSEFFKLQRNRALLSAKESCDD